MRAEVLLNIESGITISNHKYLWTVFAINAPLEDNSRRLIGYYCVKISGYYGLTNQ